MDRVGEILEKILGILGYDAYKAFVLPFFDSRRRMLEFKTENALQIKAQIMESDRLSLEQKAMLNTALDKNLIPFMSEMKVLGIALDNMDEDAKVENLDEDWILDFFDKSSRISQESTRQIWGKLLANAASDRRICSKVLLNSLFLMGSEEISDFLNVCRYCFSEMGADIKEERISAYPIIFYGNNVGTYNSEKITILRLHRLQMLGLIETDFKDEYVFIHNKEKLIYKNKIVEIIADEKIRLGNVRFTYEGFLLYSMTEKIFDSSIFNFTLEIWKRRNYTVFCNGIRI